MSILTKPYEISIWDDEWDQEQEKFVERKVCTIGSNTLQTQSKVFSPKLKRNVNGSKSLTFQLYARYVDNFTGETVENPYVKELISERKVKLKYNNDWYDFIVKNIQQDSSTYLYTYQLEDAIVTELSKNGFGVTFDQAINNNIGTVNSLAAEALEDTDWTISEDSEVIVQTVEESLVWLTTAAEIIAVPIQGQSDSRLTVGVIDGEATTIPASAKILAFYSSCTNKPHRFQFIYLTDYTNLDKDQNRVIKDKDCQYYIDYDIPDDSYQECETEGFEHFYLPVGFTLLATRPNYDTQISYLYRGARYGYSMQSEYVPLLNKYVNLYDKNGVTYYGYTDVEYISPTIIKTYVTNPTAENLSGWTGAKLEGEDAVKSAKVELAYGRFDEVSKKFISCVDDEQSNYDLYDSYVKVVIENSNQVVFNSGPYDNRYDIQYLHPNSDVLVLSDVIVYDSTGTACANPLNYFNLAEYVYDSNKLAYKRVDTKIKFTATTNNTTGIKEFGVSSNDYNNEKEFTKRSKLRLCFAPPAGTYYIKQCYLYKKYLVDGNIIKPTELTLESEDSNITGAIQRKYCYIEKEAFIEAGYVSKDEIVIDDIQDTLSYANYKPVYNIGAEKVRSITIAESNYFNILSTLAETFGVWLDLKISRDTTGSITKKEVAFRNYVGSENYAGFRYGVNLQGIQRTYESKGLVTKLIVKANSNELAENGFCTIQRAASNETGENYLYDFQYYHNQNILPAEDFLPVMQGDFVENETIPTLNGYYTRIKNINTQMLANNEILSGLKTDLITQKSNYETAEYEIEAANSEIAETVDEYTLLTGIDFETRSFYDAYSKLDSPGGFSKWPLSHTNSAGLHFHLFDTSGTQLAKNTVNARISILQQQSVQSFSIGTFKELYNNITNLNYPNENDNIKFIEKSSSSEIGLSDFETLFQDLQQRPFTFYKCNFTANPKSLSQYRIIANPLYACAGLSEITGVHATYTIDNEKSVSNAFYVVSFYGATLFLDPENDKIYYELATKSDLSDTNLTYSLLKSKEAIKLVEQYTKALRTRDDATQRFNDAEEAKIELEDQIKVLEDANQRLKDIKTVYNKLFYKTYSRFIQEGTWISEDYIDDEKYYIDAQSVLYNSCYPQVAYTINVLEVSQLPGYEGFSFDLGDKTFVEDANFFGAEDKVDVVVTETTEDLDNPKNNTLTVQNYKTQFQDLFQKITATVQQTQYSTGSYKKAVALANADADKKQEYLSDAMSTSGATLKVGGQTNIIQDGTGITLYKTNDKTRQLKLTGGAILVSKEDNGELYWSRILDPDGISANQINTGVLNANSIKIMNGDQATFAWDSYGISAYDWDDQSEIPNYKKFVRFDKHGVYGIDDTVEAGWVAQDLQEIDHLATFALTWEGLKVTGNNGAVARIGKVGNDVMRISKTVDGVEQVLMNIASNDDPDYHSTFCGWVFENNKLIAPSGTGKGQVTLSSDSISITNASGNSVMAVSANGQATFCGWTFENNELVAPDDNETKGRVILAPEHIRIHKPGKIYFTYKEDQTDTTAGTIGTFVPTFAEFVYDREQSIFMLNSTQGYIYFGLESDEKGRVSCGLLARPGGSKDIKEVSLKTSDGQIMFSSNPDTDTQQDFPLKCSYKVTIKFNESPAFSYVYRMSLSVYEVGTANSVNTYNQQYVHKSKTSDANFITFDDILLKPGREYYFIAKIYTDSGVQVRQSRNYYIFKDNGEYIPKYKQEGTWIALNLNTTKEEKDTQTLQGLYVSFRQPGLYLHNFKAMSSDFSFKSKYSLLAIDNTTGQIVVYDGYYDDYKQIYGIT